MTKNLKLIIGGQYDQGNKLCDSCVEKNLQSGVKEVKDIPQTIYLIVLDLDRPDGENHPNYYCAYCAGLFLRGLEQHLHFSPGEYAKLHKTPQQKFNEEKTTKEEEELKKRQMWEKLNNR